jgi:EmrB/QacA subfamily drug resistance transporter
MIFTACYNPTFIIRLLYQVFMDSFDYSKKWQVLITVGFGVFLATIDSSIVNISLPTLENDLHASFAAVQWVVLAYLLTITILLLGVGRLADMVGKKSLYISGFIVFMVGSFLCGISPRVELLIAFRVIQAIGGSFLMALGPALLVQGFPPDERGQALGISGLAVSLGIILGPTLGGLIISNFGWHWIFFVNIPVGIVAILIAIRSLPADKAIQGEKFDFAGALFLFLFLTSLLFGLTVSQDAGFLSPVTLLLFSAFALFLFLFVKTEGKVSHPVVDLSLFQNAMFRVNLFTGMVTFIASAGTILLIPFYLQNVLQFDPEKAGLLMAVFPITMGISSPISGYLSDRYGFRLLTIIGLAVLSFSYFNLVHFSTQTTWLEFMIIYFPLGIGMGLFQSPNNSAILGTASPSRMGVVSGLLAITRTLGQTSGIAIIGALWTSLVFQKSGYLPEGATSADVSIQVSGMHIIFIGLGAIILLAMGMTIIAWFREKQIRVWTSVPPE